MVVLAVEDAGAGLPRRLNEGEATLCLDGVVCSSEVVGEAGLLLFDEGAWMLDAEPLSCCCCCWLLEVGLRRPERRLALLLLLFSRVGVSGGCGDAILLLSTGHSARRRRSG